jgi:hypothetical protein
MSRDVREVIAQSIAYAVCSRFGPDMSLRSVEYIAGWLDDPKPFRAGMTAIHDGAAPLAAHPSYQMAVPTTSLPDSAMAPRRRPRRQRCHSCENYLGRLTPIDTN